ncbi:hypothetical protein NHX12_013592 [Muraenolepis orangiensis]|uniref:C-type lectin domain-containing protein n=1 Tax=Muraenolepis orangiensis TaxID=630683 RepID=A0A9Q0D9Q9_9TELE|nr:hypothetical protein NHX12_013592 [Muraenolepis orangiensis]
MNKYILVTKGMTWQEAQEYCRQTYGDLATVDNMDDLNQLVDLAGGVITWIGLHDFNRESMDLYPNSWRWSTQTRSQTGYMNFASGQPNYNGARQECVMMKPHGPSSAKTYHHVSQTVSWESAKSYCRTQYTDLAKIENQAENQQVSSIVTTSSWIGLSRVPWTWSDGSNGTFRHWEAGEPDTKEKHQFCTLIVNGSMHVYKEMFKVSGNDVKMKSKKVSEEHMLSLFLSSDGCFSGQHRKQGLQPELECSADKTRAGRLEP